MKYAWVPLIEGQGLRKIGRFILFTIHVARSSCPTGQSEERGEGGDLIEQPIKCQPPLSPVHRRYVHIW